MNIGFQRKIDRMLGAPICRFLSLFYRPPKGIPRKAAPERVLIILLSEMGSLVLAYPMFQRVKEKYPDASIHVLLFEKNREILEILNVVPPANILMLSDRSLVHFSKDFFRLLIRLRRLDFDTVIDCELFARISSIFSFRSGAKIRVGFHPYTQEGLYRGSFINRPVLYNPYHHISQQFITLVDAIESHTVPKAKRSLVPNGLELPSLVFEQNEIIEMRKRFNRDFSHVVGKELVLIYPSGGALPIRAWPIDNYCRLSKDLILNGYSVGVIGLENDKHFGRTIQMASQSPDCIDLTGYTRSLRELIILFSFASLLITNDGGPGQFAALTSIPTIVFYGPETPTLYGPLDKDAVIFHVSLSCSPCLTAYNHRNSPCDGENLCLKSIQPDKVLAKALEMLKDPEMRRQD